MLYDFFYRYFISPGYNIVNTTVYALLLVIGVYFIFLLLKKVKIKIDKKFAIAIAPFIIFGSIMRVIVDSKIIESFLFVSPTIYVVIPLLISMVLLIAILLEKKYKIPYHKTLFLVGLVLASFVITFIKIVNPYGAMLILLFLLPWLSLLTIARWSLENKIVSLLHIFDAMTSFISIEFFGYAEQHVVPQFFINLFTPFSFVLLKSLAIFLILILIDKECKNKEFKNYLKLIIGILGAATGARDFLRLLALT